MFDFDSSGGLDSLELGSRRRPVKWAVELNLADCRPQKHKARRRQLAQEQQKRQQRQNQHSQQQEQQPPQQQHSQQLAAAASSAESSHQQRAACAQQQAQAQRVAARSKQLEALALLQQQDPSGVTPAQAKYHKEFRDASVVCLSTEIEQGNVEYKYRLTGCATNENRRHQLTTQMKFRLSEGSGECFYYLGVEDDGYPRGLEPQELQDSIAVIHRMAKSLQATARLVEYVPGGFGRTAALLHIKANAEEDMRLTDSRVAVAGSMDSGKSTLVAVLTHGADGRPLLDNGRGSARMAVFRHKHEIESGRTSSISQQVLGYDDEGRVLNYVGVSTPTPADITAAATHMVHFIDMGGHEKYLKTTLYGMTCLLPDYALLCVDASTGITRITREHLAVAVALEVPTALVVTKAEAVGDQQLQGVLGQLHQLMQPVLCHQDQQERQQHGCVVHPAQLQPQQKREELGGVSSSSSSRGADEGYSEHSQHAPAVAGVVVAAGGGASSSTVSSSSWNGVPVVQSEAQAVTLAARLSELHSCTAGPCAPSFQQAVFPVFVVSCVTGAGVPLLHAFLSNLKQQQHNTQQQSGGGVSGGGAPLPAAAAAGILPSQQQQQQQPCAVSTAGGSSTTTRDCSSQLWGVLPQKPHPNKEAAQHSGEGMHTDTPTAAAATTTQDQPAAQQQPQQEQQEDEACDDVDDDDSVVGPPGHFQVVHTYDVEGVGWVVSGIAVTGTIEVGQSLLWGPTPEGGFSPVRVSCIQRSHVPVRQIAPGQTATLALQAAAGGLPHSGSKQALLTAAAVAQAAAAEAAAREAAAAIAAVPEPVAQTRRRSPAALKAAAAAAASTAATAAAAAEAAKRAAEVAGGKGWWLGQQQEQTQQGSASSWSVLTPEHSTAVDAAAAAADSNDGTHTAAAAAAHAVASGPRRVAAGGASLRASSDSAGGGVADLLLGDDEFAAGLLASDDADDADGGGSDSFAHLFGEGEGDDEPIGCADSGAGSSSGSNGGSAQQQSATPPAAAAGDEDDDLFAGLAGVFADDVTEQAAGAGACRNSSSSCSSSGLSSSGSSSNRWSFSSCCGGGSGSERHDSSLSLSSARDAAMPATDAEGDDSQQHHHQQQQQCGAVPAAASNSVSAVASLGLRLGLSSSSLGTGGAVSDQQHLLGSSPSRWRNKGGVLLAAAAAPPHTYWEFEAQLVLLGGHWPPRGLVSGCWPPADDSSAAGAAAAAGDACAGAAAAAVGTSGSQPAHTHASDQQQQEEESADGAAGPALQRSNSSRKQRRGSGKQFEFAYVVHCNSIRQIARVVCMQELRGDVTPLAQRPLTGAEGETAAPVPTSRQVQFHGVQQHCGLTASICAAAALLQATPMPAHAAAGGSDKESPSPYSSSSSSGCGSGDSSGGGGGGDGSRRQRQRRLGVAGGGSSSAAASSVAVRRGSNPDAGSVVAVRLRFTHRPEWMQVGARLIVRDRSDGHVAAAGFVTKLLEPHTQLQLQHHHQHHHQRHHHHHQHQPRQQ